MVFLIFVLRIYQLARYKDEIRDMVVQKRKSGISSLYLA